MRTKVGLRTLRYAPGSSMAAKAISQFVLLRKAARSKKAKQAEWETFIRSSQPGFGKTITAWVKQFVVQANLFAGLWFCVDN